MAIRQYIGARYVLKIYENSLDPQSADWEAGVAYEPLVMVNYNNSSYISRKQVPANVGDPVSNPTYWALSGLYNGQIAQLQNDVGTLQNDVGDLQNDVGDIQDVITDYSESLNHPIRRVMIISDSYGNRVNSNSKNFAEVAADISGITVDMIKQAGAGLINGQIVNLINGYTGDGSVYDTVIYLGGANDESGAITQFSSFGAYFTALKGAINTKFPNAKNLFVMCTGMTFKTDSATDSNKNRHLLLAYRENARALGFGYVANSEYILRNNQYLESDMCHPNAAGVDRIGSYVAEFLMNGSITVDDYTFSVFTDMASRSYNFIMRRKNNQVTITRVAQGAGYLVTGSGTSIPIDGTYQKLGSFTNYIINSDNTGIGIYCANTSNQALVVANGVVEPIELNLHMENGDLKGYLTSFKTSGLAGGFHIIGSSVIFIEP